MNTTEPPIQQTIWDRVETTRLLIDHAVRQDPLTGQYEVWEIDCGEWITCIARGGTVQQALENALRTL